MTLRDELRLAVGRMVEMRGPRERPHELEVNPIVAADKPRDLVAIDGSYTFLLNMGSTWLAVARAAAIPYACSGERFHPKPPTFMDRAITVSTWEELATQDELHRQLYEATKGRSDQEREMVNEFRKYLESELALKIAREAKGVVLALDGSLSTVPKEFDRLDDVAEACEANDNILLGVSKDSFLHAFGRALPDEQVLQGYDGMGYVRVPKDFEMRQRGLLRGDVYFARLHPQARKWFRVDLGTSREDPDTAFAHLAAHARSGLSLGYPYALMEAHRLAVMVRHFREPLEDEILKEAGRLGLSMGEVAAGLTAIEGRRRGAFHVYLDQFAREVK